MDFRNKYIIHAGYDENNRGFIIVRDFKSNKIVQTSYHSQPIMKMILLGDNRLYTFTNVTKYSDSDNLILWNDDFTSVKREIKLPDGLHSNLLSNDNRFMLLSGRRGFAIFSTSLNRLLAQKDIPDENNSMIGFAISTNSEYVYTINKLDNDQFIVRYNIRNLSEVSKTYVETKPIGKIRGFKDVDATIIHCSYGVILIGCKNGRVLIYGEKDMKLISSFMIEGFSIKHNSISRMSIDEANSRVMIVLSGDQDGLYGYDLKTLKENWRLDSGVKYLMDYMPIDSKMLIVQNNGIEVRDSVTGHFERMVSIGNSREGYAGVAITNIVTPVEHELTDVNLEEMMSLYS